MTRRRILGLVPAAGSATRLPELAGSKEILALPGVVEGAPPGATEPVIAGLLGQMERAGIERALVILRRGKWDIPDLLTRRPVTAPALAYLCIESSASIVETLSHAAPFLADANVALGFPDILLQPPDALQGVVRRFVAGTADVVLGLFPTDHPERADMVRTDARGRVRSIEVKPGPTDLERTWMVAVWSPRFTTLLLEAAGDRAPEGGEIYPGHVVQRAVDLGFEVDTVAFDSGSALDVGTPEDLARASLRSDRKDG